MIGQSVFTSVHHPNTHTYTKTQNTQAHNKLTGILVYLICIEEGILFGKMFEVCLFVWFLNILVNN